MHRAWGKEQGEEVRIGELFFKQSNLSNNINLFDISNSSNHQTIKLFNF